MVVLGIEASCDETSVAVVEDGKKIVAHVIKSQIDLHNQYGGVVPEVASRSHLEVIVPVLQTALKQAFGSDSLYNENTWKEIDAIAVSRGPGLSGALLMGTMTARSLAWLFNKPVHGVNHVLGHTYANFLKNDQPEFPLLSLTASGGHTQLILLNNFFDYKILGQTKDDAVGEAFDKVAKMLGLSYPGGPSISNTAQSGDKLKYKFPKARLSGKYDFSFSGLKTAVLRKLQSEVGESINFPSYKIAEKLTKQQIADFAASFEHTAISTLTDKLRLAIEEYTPTTVVIGGGVAANLELQRQAIALNSNIKILPAELCTDNAAMIAGLGFYQSKHVPPADIYNLTIQPSLSL